MPQSNSFQDIANKINTILPFGWSISIILRRHETYIRIQNTDGLTIAALTNLAENWPYTLGNVEDYLVDCLDFAVSNEHVPTLELDDAWIKFKQKLKEINR